MLLPIRPGTPTSAVFSGLNTALGAFLDASVNATTFDANLFPGNVGAALWTNPDTKAKFKVLWNAMQTQTMTVRQQLRDAFTNHQQQIPNLFGDPAHPLPVVSADLETSLHALVSHLFTRSSKLSGIEAACAETVQDHFNNFRNPYPSRNGNICCACGTEALAAFRAEVDPDDQWRGPYDHLLAKEKYPLFGVHPRNLMPICHTCNSKAKLAKDLLRTETGSRTRSFYPWTESAHSHVQIVLNTDEATSLLPTVKVKLEADAPETNEKLQTWDRVYDIKRRVEGEFSALIEKIAQDIGPASAADLATRLPTRATHFIQHSRTEAWNFWRAKLYSAIAVQGNELTDRLWDAFSFDARYNSDRHDLYGM
jgi:hypothetical protein